MTKTNKIRVRSAILDDLPILKRFEQGIIKAERPYDPTLKPDPISYYDIGKLIERSDAEVAIATYENKPIGSGYALREKSLPYVTPDAHAFIGFLFVEPEYRGRGVNRLILDHLFLWSKANGLTQAKLEVYPENMPALRAYEKAGFSPYLVTMQADLTN